MMITRLARSLGTTAAVAIFTTLMPAQITRTTLQAAPQESAADERSNDGRPNAIVGSWFGVLGNGDRVTISFTSDGISVGSVTNEVSLDPAIATLTSPRGVWKYLGGRRFSITAVALLYNLPPKGPGTYQGRIYIQSTVMIDKAGDQMSGTDRVSIFDADDQLLDSFPGTVRYTRIKPDPLN
jgi:hypothetical protein